MRIRIAAIGSITLMSWGCVSVEPTIVPDPSLFARIPRKLPPARQPQRAHPTRVVRPTTKHKRVEPPRFERSWVPPSGRIHPRWTSIVVHHSATSRGGAKTFDRFHRAKGWDELGYHFVIGNGSDTPDGFVEVGPRWRKQKTGAHCKTPNNHYNDHGIGICLVGDFTKSRPSARQMASLTRLTKFLCYYRGIPATNVTSHSRITGNTQCPGARFPLARLQQAVGVSINATSLP